MVYLGRLVGECVLSGVKGGVGEGGGGGEMAVVAETLRGGVVVGG